ncbi:MAG: hypothetical protein R3C03_09340 [Pirellulaceae bacterium]
MIVRFVAVVAFIGFVVPQKSIPAQEQLERALGISPGYSLTDYDQPTKSELANCKLENA